VFYGCESLKTVTIAEGVTSIGYGAFSECFALETVSIPSTVTSIDGFAFSQCYSLTKINFNGTAAKWNAIQKGDAWDNLSENYTVYCTDGNIAK
jgi:hypothetical protein